MVQKGRMKKITQVTSSVSQYHQRVIKLLSSTSAASTTAASGQSNTSIQCDDSGTQFSALTLLAQG